MHVFAILAEPVRRRIVELLAAHEHDVTRLCELICPEFSISRQAVSHHLRVLRDTGFVEVREWGLVRRYRLAWDALDRLDAEVEKLFVIWEERAGWPYAIDLPEPPARLRHIDRKGLRGRQRADVEPRDAAEEDWWSMFRD